MSRHQLKSDLWVTAPIEKVWQIAQDSKNLIRLTPAWYHPGVEVDGPAYNGQQVKITMAPLGVPVPLPWLAVISGVQADGPKREFTDTQETGPFKYWCHRHEFESGVSVIEGQRTAIKMPVSNPGTWIRDRLEYEMPLMQAGETAHLIFARRMLEDMFAYRRQAWRSLLAETL